MRPAWSRDRGPVSESDQQEQQPGGVDSAIEPDGGVADAPRPERPSEDTATARASTSDDGADDGGDDVVDEREPGQATGADADIQTRKVLFRQAALEHVTILRQIDSILKRKSDHAMADEFFNDILDEHFAEEEVQRQFETATNWGRYAEIFDYDRETGRLTQTETTTTDPPADSSNSTSASKS